MVLRKIISQLKDKYSDNLIAIYGVGSCFDDTLPSNWIKNDLDLILIVKSIDKIPRKDWYTRSKTKKFSGQNLFTGFNTIESYNSKADFNKISVANYEWSLICLKYPTNSRLLYGEDIRNQIPDTITLNFDYGDILARGFYHLEKSLQAKKTSSAKKKYSKGVFKIAFYLCVFFVNSFRYTSLMKIGSKIQQLNKQGKIDTEILEFFEEAMIYRTTRQYKTDFSTLREKIIYFMFSLLEKGKLHKKMNHSELVKYLSTYFGGFPYLIRKAKDISLSKTLS
ncbi:hypothetical protein LCGC14_1752560 [marine sediment metagenome]|uniref:Uncharacterized protein n=1 Tax=marine sediment metagenome TaxID=412755 RepID=A0A0F9H3E5_9ZZZZ